MQQGIVYFNDTVAGILQKLAPDSYRFIYDEAYLANSHSRSISLTLPKTKRQHDSKELFPFFAGLLSEGVNKKIQCRLLKIDEDDDFTRLLKTAGTDTIGAITVKEME